MPDPLSNVLKRLSKLPKGLADHVERAREVGQELAKIHHLDAERVDFALAAHDLARSLINDELVDEAERLGLALTAIEEREPILIHGWIAAIWLEREEAVSDSEVLEAVRWHTTGKPGMGEIAKAVFLADKLDPDKAGYYPFQPDLLKLATVSMDHAITYFIDRQLEFFVENGYLIHPNSVELRNDLIIGLETRRPQ